MRFIPGTCLISEDSSNWTYARIITVNIEEVLCENQKIQERGKMPKGNDDSVVVPAQSFNETPEDSITSACGEILLLHDAGTGSTDR